MTLIASRKDPSKAKARRGERERKNTSEKRRKREGKRDTMPRAIITTVRNSVFLSVVMPRRGSRGNRDEGPGGLETKFGTSDLPDDIYTRMRKLGRLTVKFVPRHENPLCKSRP